MFHGYLDGFGYLTSWNQIPPPNQDKVVHLEYLPTSMEVVISTNDQQKYSYRYGWEEFVPSKDEKTLLWGFIDFKCNEEFVYEDYYWVASPPGDVVSRLDCEIRYSEMTELQRFVLLENGEVWTWRTFSDIDGFRPHHSPCLGGSCMSIFGGIIGITYYAIRLQVK